MSHSPKFHARAGSRASLVSVGQMPVIDEDSNTIAMQPSSTTAATPPPPAVLRVPAKTPRRSMDPLTEGPPLPHIVGRLDLPPGVLTAAECKDEDDEGDEETVVGQMTPGRRMASEEERWEAGGLQRRCHLVLVMAVVLVLLVGLAVGLSLGLTKSETDGHDDGSRNTFLPDLPTGTFAFDPILQASSSECTSDPNTWRCLSSEEGSLPRFSWTITQENALYRISSRNDPIASFTNIPLVILDGGEEDERLTFSFKMNVTVKPLATTTNRAAKCTYPDTTYTATLWTKRGTQKPYSSIQTRRAEYGSWMGLVEVAETKNAALGVPECVDARGDAVADVQARLGTCECVYRTKGWT
ncbi:hypothetical protein J3F83DRAFT_727863 [Trichoderma novae-zelandiae]